MIMMTARKIRALRTALKLTQTAFAVKMHVCQNTIARWELDLSHPTFERQRRLNDMATAARIDLN
mgnify:CR=1 FL=1